VSIGDTLAESRRQAGLTITQVSQRTRIRESIIRGIEQGDFSACGGDFYARGHIRSIAGAIGIDPVPLVREYDDEHGTPGGISAADVFEPSTPIRIRERRSPSLTMIVMIVLLGVIGYGAYHLVASHGHKAAAGAGATATAHASTVRTSATPSPSAKPSQSPVVPADEVVVQLTALQNCWILLSNVSTGAQIFEGDVPAGQTMNWTEKYPVSLRLGNPPGVQLIVDGKRVSTNTPDVETLTFSPPQT
jgi:cytoskeletal protein RodZ